MRHRPPKKGCVLKEARDGVEAVMSREARGVLGVQSGNVHNDVVDRDVDELDEEADETHHEETDGCGGHCALELCTAQSGGNAAISNWRRRRAQGRATRTGRPARWIPGRSLLAVRGVVARGTLSPPPSHA